MAAADELFLLSQNSADIGDNLISKWKIYFEWLDEVVHTSKQSRGEMVIPKTPARKKRVKKNEDLENLPPPPPPPTDNKGVRKSSRAAAKVAQEKNKKALIEISNINSKIRRPSTPPKIVKTEFMKSISDEEDIEETTETVDQISPHKFSSDDNYRSLCEEKVVNIKSKKESERKLSEKESERNLSEKVSERKLSEKESEMKSENESVRKLSDKESKKKLSEKKSEMKSENESVRKLPEKEAKRKLSEKKDYERKVSIANESDESAIEIQEMPPPSFDVKKVDENFQREEPANVVSSLHSPLCNKPTRVTRTKKRVVEEAEQGVTPIRSTRSKKIKVDESDKFNGYVKLMQLNYNEKSSVIKEEISHSPLHKPISKEPAVGIATSNFPQRITRSKVRPMTPKKATPGKLNNSPLRHTPKNNNNNNKAPHTPKNKFNSLLISNQYSGSPKDKILQSKTNTVNKHTKNAVNVHEVSVESVKVSSSPTKVVKHKWNENSFMSENAKIGKSKTSYRTPSPASSSTIKILGLKNGYSSVGLQSAYSQKRKNLLSSPQIIGTKVIGTPTEVNRTKNILMGSSFITKVQPSKPTKEEMDDKKQEDLRRKREKEDETRKKKEDILRMKMEEQKRKNEERMRRVQEARELREKKMVESRELQEREKKQREHRVKEDKKKRLMEAKKNEEMKQLKKQAEEESRLKEERRIREEQKQKEEQRQMEELKAKEEKIMEERRKQEERKLVERHEAERLAKEKLEWEKAKAAERIAKEKKEMEQLRLKEIDRLQSQKNMNESYTEANPMNSTYTKPPSCSASLKNDDIQSYEMTPLVKKVLSKSKSANDYGITDLRSDDSTDDESAPKKKIPSWAQGSQLRKHLFDQEHFPPNLDAIFDPAVLLEMPDLIRIFPKRRSRFTKRTSSAVWNTPPYKLFAQK